jgi:cellobiose phosphorylase
MAACVANRPEQAFRMYESAALARVGHKVERFQHEPYVYPENYVGPEHRFGGRGQYQWCLGEGANWMWHAYVSYILGVRADLRGLLVDPKIPSTWKTCKVNREFRGARYEIEILNPKGAGMGVSSLSVDGQEISGNLIPPHRDDKAHRVKVVLG